MAAAAEDLIRSVEDLLRLGVSGALITAAAANAAARSTVAPPPDGPILKTTDFTAVKQARCMGLPDLKIPGAGAALGCSSAAAYEDAASLSAAEAQSASPVKAASVPVAAAAVKDASGAI